MRVASQAPKREDGPRGESGEGGEGGGEGGGDCGEEGGEEGYPTSSDDGDSGDSGDGDVDSVVSGDLNDEDFFEKLKRHSQIQAEKDAKVHLRTYGCSRPFLQPPASLFLSKAKYPLPLPQYGIEVHKRF